MPKDISGSAFDQAGSSEQISGPFNPNVLGGAGGQPGQTDVAKSDADYKVQYEELQKKLGEQGRELGNFRQLYEDMSPLLSKLDEQKELIPLIMENKFAPEIIQAIAEGKINITDAKEITKTHGEVKKDIGLNAYNEAKPEEIEKLITEKIKEEALKIQKTVDEREEMKSFDQNLQYFVASVPDFNEYAAAVNEWFDNHPTQTDIEMAYKIVKAEALEKKAQEDEEKWKAEDAKGLAANAAGGGSRSSAVIKDDNLADQLIGGRRNPNVF